MVERRAPQTAIDTTALEKASALEARVDGHEDLCTERFKNLAADIAGVKGDIQQLNEDASDRLDKLDAKQETNHRSNAETLRVLTTGLAQLSQQFGNAQGERAGLSDAGNMLTKIMPIMLSTMTLLYLIFGKHP